ncbi:P-loop containing nucleoside triphosphate hydrolase protein [Russula earlei]|uniref:P-loop containing nucleoside triphosphate hydrolase protein n=1 Tax=Russula earlei TaxID=71964 RepID=A0ACC0U847_9AGAM|nr:P-loop containing nucleoside triphosphate hydrolase protein [Russula earlei]
MAASFPPLGRSAADLISINKRFSSSCIPLDRLLGGGLPSGHVLELSGPPGTAKEILATKFASSAVSVNDQVLFVDMQNMASPATLHPELRSKNLNLVDASLELVYYLTVFTLPDLLIISPQSSLESSQIRLVILNSIWFPFQTAPGLTMSRRATLLVRVKQVLAKLCSSLDIAVVTTTQLATKFLNPDGTPTSFDSGSRAVLVPLLGKSVLAYNYLPPHRTYRVLIVPETRTSGFDLFVNFTSQFKELYIFSEFCAYFRAQIMIVRTSPSKSHMKW